MGILIFLLVAMVLLTFSMAAFQLFFNINIMGRLFRGNTENDNHHGQLDHDAQGNNVALQLKSLEEAQTRLRTQYPVVARMFGAYLHGESLHNAGGLESAVKEMVLDWRSEREAVISDIARILADNPDEESVRAIVISFCDARFEEEGYRTWLIWLQGQFNEL